MIIPKEIDPEYLPELWQFKEELERRSRKQWMQKEACGLAGHIAFHSVLAVWGFLFSYFVISADEKYVMLPWLSSIINKLLSFLVEPGAAFGFEHFLIVLGCVVGSLLAIPFVVTGIVRVITGMMPVKTYTIRVPQGVTPRESAQMLLKEVQKVSKSRIGITWEYYYPMEEVGELITINLFNYIPALCMFVPCVLAVAFGTVWNAGLLAGAVLLSAILACFFLLPVVPLWKLSSILCVLLYKDLTGPSADYLVSRLVMFIDKCLVEEDLARLREAKALFEKATEGETVDIDLLKKATELGSPEARLCYGRILYEEYTAKDLADYERKKKAKGVMEILEEIKDQYTEAEFFLLDCRHLLEEHPYWKWSEMAQRVEMIQKSGRLPAKYGKRADWLIDEMRDISYKEWKIEKEKEEKAKYYSSYTIPSTPKETEEPWDGAGANGLPWGTGMIDVTGM